MEGKVLLIFVQLKSLIPLFLYYPQGDGRHNLLRINLLFWYRFMYNSLLEHSLVDTLLAKEILARTDRREKESL